MTPLKVHMTPEERRILEAIAVDDVRTPEQTLRWLALEEAKRRGIMSQEARSIALDSQSAIAQ